MENVKVSVITPTVRKDALEMNKACLNKQTMSDSMFEWIIVSPKDCIDDKNFPKETVWVSEPKSNHGDFYNLNKAWNKGIRESVGELIVSIVDLLWFPPNTLSTLWRHYKADNKACVGLIGHQYEKIVDGKPENLVWRDPRIRYKSFYQIPGYDLELCIASLPRKGVFEVGGFDEEYDQAPAWSEKDFACRMEKAGYTCYIDEAIQYRALHHERLSEDWDELYPQSTDRFQKHYSEIQEGKRLRLDYL